MNAIILSLVMFGAEPAAPQPAAPGPQPPAGPAEAPVVGKVVVDLDEGGAGELMLSVRTPPQIFLRDANGIPSQVGSMMLHRLPPVLGDPLSRLMQRATVGDLTPYGMPRPERGVLSDFRDRDQVPILDVGLIRLLKQGRVKVVPAVESFDGPRVWLRGGESVEPDAVIAATGVDFISAGALTHSVQALDLSMKVTRLDRSF